MFEIIERRLYDTPASILKEDRCKPVNIVNEANRLALAGSCTCCDTDDAQMSDFEKATLIFESAILLDELTSSLFPVGINMLQALGTDQSDAKALVDKLHSLAEELAGVRASELYSLEVTS